MNLNYNNFFKDGEFFIHKNVWNQLNLEYSKHDIKIEILKAIREYNLPLPFKNPTYDEHINDFKHLLTEDVNKIEKYGEWFTRYDYKWTRQYQNVLNYIYLDGTNTGLQSSNYFHMNNRLKCDSINSPSPIRVWESDKFMLTLMNYFWSGMVNGDITMNTFKNAIGMRKYIASQFKPSVAKYIYNRFAPNGNVLDFSSGWGDRFTGFYASQAKQYVGVDPNANLFQGYIEQITEYSKIIGDKKGIFVNDCAENVPFVCDFDLIFTSPPYFDVERYTKDETQSYKRYKTLNKWLDGFLFKSIDKFWKNLKQNGYLILNISDVYCHHTIQKICDPMNDFISNLSGSQYQGAIGMRMAKRPNTKALKDGIFCEPMWIWKKI